MSKAFEWLEVAKANAPINRLKNRVDFKRKIRLKPLSLFVVVMYITAETNESDKQKLPQGGGVSISKIPYVFRDEISLQFNIFDRLTLDLRLLFKIRYNF